MKSCKAFSAPAGVKAFCPQKVIEVPEEVVIEVKREVMNMADEAKRGSPTRSTLKYLKVMQHEVRCCLGEEWGSFC